MLYKYFLVQFFNSSIEKYIANYINESLKTIEKHLSGDLTEEYRSTFIEEAEALEVISENLGQFFEILLFNAFSWKLPDRIIQINLFQK